MDDPIAYREMMRLCDELRKHPSDPLIAEVSREFAKRLRRRLDSEMGLSLTWSGWTRLTQILETDIDNMLRHTAREMAQEADVSSARRFDNDLEAQLDRFEEAAAYPVGQKKP